ncbi:MAG: molybdopterin-dependent oxidoreductase [Deltaproteobacteria bacterium]|nr:molybdopterin-dependent oxidoreductase [Deltaproteobacteria bacterium]MDQ3295118.1 molybdopterin-dependent oxidoreductase [Myxococcota bacterium]
MTTTTHYRSCPLCEATCGVAVTVDGDRVTSVRGDDDDPFSRGYICPKGTALADLHDDPDRLRHPMIREGSSWREVDWDTALDHVAAKLLAVRAAHGKDAIAVYQGNPTAHNLGLITYGQLLMRTLGTRNAYSATSLDQLPHMLAALLMFGNQLLMPVPDIDRSDLFICLGANPLASNGSIMTAPDVKGRLKAIRDRGGLVIVLDPRRTETADKADRHLFIRPATDAVLLLAMIHVLFADYLVTPSRPRRLETTGLDALRAAASAWTPERAAVITGVAAADIRELARALARTPRAVLYGRVGVCTQEFGGLAAWLCYAVNALTGHLDEPGGLMFTTPAIDPLPLAKLLGFDGGFARYRSRVSGKPEFGGEFPVTVLAEEIETPGDGQIRALITSAGNPVLSAPGGPRLEQAFAKLDFMVSIDPYMNETTRLAHVILPPTSALERSHYDAALNAFAVRNVAKYSPPLFERAADARHDWEICLALWTRLGVPRRLGPGARLVRRLLGKLGPEAIVDLALRAGPHRLSLKKLRAAPHGLDLGPLESRLPGRLATTDRKVHLAPAEYLADLARLERRFAAPAAGHGPGDLVLIGRRHLRDNNSWMHNTERLVKGPPRCTLLIHPNDAALRGLAAGDRARVSTTKGAIELVVEVSDTMMPGVVSVPHGWGHGRAGTRLRVASAHAGASVNDIVDPAVIDELSGTSALTGQRVEVARA